MTVAEIAEALEPLARHALASYALDVAGLELITNDWNYVYRVDLRDGDRRVLRVSLPDRRTRAQVDAEMHWLDALARESDVRDFDDSLVGWPVQDLGITWFALEGRDGFDELTLAFREGYERVAPWPEREPGEIATFAADRCLVLANYQVQDHDPKYLAQAPEDIKRYAKKIERFLGEGA